MPKISVVIICYDMAREIERTVHSFLPPYQTNLDPDDVEVIVLDNGSNRPPAAETINSWPRNVRYIFLENAHPSPAKALNFGASIAKANIICPVIDGARMASPGLLASGLSALKYSERTLAATISFHLGDELQQIAVTKGYNQEVEDELLRTIDWATNGYRLFEIAAPGGSSRSAWFGTISESNAPILRKSLYNEVCGFDERFDIPGGGFVNLDFLSRLLQTPDVDYFLIVGEATFHQFHGGVTTSRHVQLPEEDGETTYAKYNRQYEKLRGHRYSHPSKRPKLFGEFNLNAVEIASRGLKYISEN